MQNPIEYRNYDEADVQALVRSNVKHETPSSDQDTYILPIIEKEDCTNARTAVQVKQPVYFTQPGDRTQKVSRKSKAADRTMHCTKKIFAQMNKYLINNVGATSYYSDCLNSRTSSTRNVRRNTFCPSLVE